MKNKNPELETFFVVVIGMKSEHIFTLANLLESVQKSTL